MPEQLHLVRWGSTLAGCALCISHLHLHLRRGCNKGISPMLAGFQRGREPDARAGEACPSFSIAVAVWTSLAKACGVKHSFKLDSNFLETSLVFQNISCVG